MSSRSHPAKPASDARPRRSATASTSEEERADGVQQVDGGARAADCKGPYVAEVGGGEQDLAASVDADVADQRG